jgi:ring-1,2-phenylacetyl-CoA epoxidase subunit PaaE
MSVAFHPLKIAEVVRETANAVSLSFDVPDDLADAFTFRPGQHLTLRADINGEDVRRNYSLCVSPGEGRLRVAIKQVAGGAFSSWAMANLKPGATIEVMPPHGSFTADIALDRPVHFAGFACGSGITPILSLLKATLEVGAGNRFTLIYGNHDSSSVIFLEEIAQLKNRYMGRLEVYHFLSAEEEDVELFNGRLDRAKCDEILSGLVDASGIDEFFICGPAPMMDAAEAALKQAGVDQSAIHVERFTADRPDGAKAAELATFSAKAAGLPMRITLDGRTRQVQFDAQAGNILESARAAGLSAPFACKAGVCATCRAKVVSGTVRMAARYGLTDAEIAAGYILTCQSFPEGEGLVLDYDQ